MEMKLVDTGLGEALFMMNVFMNAITEENLNQTNVLLDVENQPKDGMSNQKIEEKENMLFFPSFRNVF